MEDEPTAGGGGVQRLVQGTEADAALAQPGHDGDEVLQGAAQPVQRGHHEGVAGAQVVQRFPQLLALGGLAGLLVGEDAETARRGEGC